MIIRVLEMIRGARRLVAAALRHDHGHGGWSRIFPRNPTFSPQIPSRQQDIMLLAKFTSRCYNPRPFSTSPSEKQPQEAEILEAEVVVEQKDSNPSEEDFVLPGALRDIADADEFSQRFERMIKLNTRLKGGIAVMGLTQLLSGWWIVASGFKADTLYFWYTGLSATLSLQIAYMLHSTVRKVPPNLDRGAPKLLTLPLYTVKSVSNFFARTYVIVLISTTGLIGALAYEVIPSLGLK